MLATADNAKDFFNGKDLTGWDGDPKLWSVENGEIVGKTATGIKKNQFLVSDLVAHDFRLSLKVKLTPNKENSGVQFRSEPLPDGEMRGPQADVGAGWWGKLYEESGRGLLGEGGRREVREAGRVERLRGRGRRQPRADLDQRQPVRRPGRPEDLAPRRLRLPDPQRRPDGGAVQGHETGSQIMVSDASQKRRELATLLRSVANRSSATSFKSARFPSYVVSYASAFAIRRLAPVRHACR